MEALGPGALGEIFDDAARHRADATERIDDLALRQLQRSSDAGGSTDSAEDRGWMEAGLMRHGRREQREPAHHFGADRNAKQRRRPIRIVALAGGEDRWND